MNTTIVKKDMILAQYQNYFLSVSFHHIHIQANYLI
jgi:hypothetical protein